MYFSTIRMWPRLATWRAAVAAFALAATLTACSALPTAPDEPADTTTVHYTAVGASDAIGIGASVPCVPFTQCPTGTGYVQVIARRLAEGGKTVDLANLGIPGAVLSARIQSISAAYPPRVDFTFMERELPFVPRDTTVATIFAGGNDVNVVARSVTGEGGSNPRGYIDDQARKFATEMQQLVDGIRERAPEARIVIANLPNFAGAPFTSGYSMDARRVLQTLSVQFTTIGINPLAAKSNVAVVDLMCEPRFYQSSTYSSDGFHPSDAGYQIMADLMLAAIRATSYPAPASSCGQMSIVPSL